MAETPLGPLSSTQSPDESQMSTPFSVEPVWTEDNDFIQNIDLSRFGLRTSKDVIAFLHTPAGEETLNEISQEIAAEMVLEQKKMAEADQESLAHLVRASVLLGLISKNAHATAKQKEFAQQALEHLKHQSKSSVTHSASDREAREQFNRRVEGYYQQAEQMIAEQMASAAAEREMLTDRVQRLEEEGKDLGGKYDLYQKEVNDVEASSDNATPEEIEKEIAALTESMESQVDEINKLVEHNHEARELLAKHNATNLKVAHLKDLLAVHQGEKCFTDEKGNVVSSAKDAHFILNKGEDGQPSQKIVQDKDGKMYLLKAGQDWDSVKDNKEALKEASQNYEHAKQELMTVKKVVQHHKVAEAALNKDQIAQTQDKLVQNTNEQRNLANQLSLVQAARAQLEQNHPNLEQAGVVLPSASVSSTKSAAHSVGSSINQLRAAQVQLTDKEVLDIIEKLPVNARAKLEAELNNFPAQKLNAAVRSGTILPEQMRFLFQALERIGVDIQPDKTRDPLAKAKAELTAPSTGESKAKATADTKDVDPDESPRLSSR